MRGPKRCLAIVLLGAACSHSPRPETIKTGSSQFITGAEITESGAINAYDAIVMLRANFFTTRGKTSFAGKAPLPTVYVDGIAYGEVASLKNISAKEVSSIRFYQPWEATTKFGTGNMGGVIEVMTRTQ